MIALLDHFAIPREEGAAADRGAVTPMGLAALCQEVENRVVGAPCGIMDQVTSCYGRPGTLLRMVCQPHELQPPLALPAGMRVLGIDSNVRHSVGGPQYGRTRCAAFMGHRIILDRMRRIGAAAGRELTGDPLRGYLANLDPDDYKRIFRPALPESIKGGEFLLKYGPTIDAATTVEPDVDLPGDPRGRPPRPGGAARAELRRVPRAGRRVDRQGAAADSRERGRLLDKAGHLMYASHLSYTNDAMLGAPECDLLVQLVRDRERHGLYGAKITGGGSGGTVAVLADEGERRGCRDRGHHGRIRAADRPQARGVHRNEPGGVARGHARRVAA